MKNLVSALAAIMVAAMLLISTVRLASVTVDTYIIAVTLEDWAQLIITGGITLFGVAAVIMMPAYNFFCIRTYLGNLWNSPWIPFKRNTKKTRVVVKKPCNLQLKHPN